MNKNFASLCTPAKLYFILSFISCVIAFVNGVQFMTVAINLIIAFVWTVILGWFCNKGFTDFSWVLVLLPYIMMVLVFFKIINESSKGNILAIVPPSVTEIM